MTLEKLKAIKKRKFRTEGVYCCTALRMLGLRPDTKMTDVVGVFFFSVCFVPRICTPEFLKDLFVFI